MSDTLDKPVPYRVTYSEFVQQQLKMLIAAARARGDVEALLLAIREFDRRLQIYPQFGEPLVDLRAQEGQMRLGVVAPLSMRYAVLEEERVVFVTVPPVLMSRRAAG